MYDIIYADPPWDYNGREQHANRKSAVKSAIGHYNTMTLDKLKELNIPSICNKNCLLFLWTTSPHLKQGIELMEAWGFKYKTIAFVWDKQKTNPGYYTLSRCEICLVGKRGHIPYNRGSRKEQQFLSEMRGRHSAKPIEIRNRIERMFPTHKRVELFARDKVDGWDSWGNEIQVEPSLAIKIETPKTECLGCESQESPYSKDAPSSD